jgi:uncharacterized protein (DUF58 family)
MLLCAVYVGARGWLSADQVVTATLAWWGVCVAIIIVLLYDRYSWRADYASVHACRTTPMSLALGVDNTVALKIENHSSRRFQMLVTDEYPAEVAAIKLPCALTLESAGDALLRYKVLPLRRGTARFGRICLRLTSRLGFWQRDVLRGESEQVKVYPNFRSIAGFRTLGLQQHIGQLGIHVKPRRGQGLDFHQLREFREGDALNQIDWKATSRVRKLISREYQDERDQDIIFALDCGRRMHAKDGELSHFDHVLNAFLLTSHVALRQGDAVGLMAFAGQERWVNPMKGQHSINALLNQVYDLHSSTETSDFVELAQQLINKRKKRSLIILVTNLHEEDSDDISAAMRLICKQHRVIVASLRENFLDETLSRAVHNFDSALSYAGTLDYLGRRSRMLKRLRKQGVVVADALPHLLHIDLINEYLSLKRRGAI